MRIDAFNHFFPKAYFDKLLQSGPPDIGKRATELPALHDLDVRRRIIDSFPDYKQVISLARADDWTGREGRSGARARIRQGRQ